MTAANEVAVRPVRTAGELLRVAWDRAWRFPPVLRRDTPERQAAALGWTWQWLVVAWLAGCLLPLMLLDAQARHTRITAGASVLARPSHVVGPVRRIPAAVAAVWVATCAAVTAFAGAAEAGAVAGWWPALVVLAVWVPAVMLGAFATLRRSPQAKLKALAARAAQLAGPTRTGYSVADVVASRQHTGAAAALMEQLQRQWAAEGAVAVLHAASPTLVGYYRALGWEIDPAGDGLRMCWPAGTAS